MLRRSIKCAHCGASKEAADDAVVIVCDFCGSYICIANEQLWKPENIAERTKEAMRRALDPTAAEARWQKLAEIIAFDSDLRSLEARGAEIIAGLHKGEDPFAVAEAYLQARRDCDRRLFAHPDYPAGMDRPDPEQSARDALRTILRGQGFIIPAEAMERIQRELLGDRETKKGSTCDNCGAAIDADTVQSGRCPYCGGRIAVSAGDSQVQGLLSIFAAVQATVADEQTLAVTAINLALAPVFSGGTAPPADVVDAYLQQAWKGRDPDLLRKALQTLGPMAASHPSLGSLLKAIGDLLRRW
jgi:DNA-directed RNA polymerase subunit RPC12/RpoP